MNTNSSKSIVVRLFKCGVFVLMLSICAASVACSAETELSKQQDNSLVQRLLGKTPEDQFFLGMFTYHFDPKSRRTRNWKQNLIGLQYNGLFFATFENSFYNRCWTAGIARELLAVPLANDWKFAAGYRVGGIYGYNDGEAPFAGASPIIPLVELYAQSVFHDHFGLELMLTSSISLGFFYQF